MIKLAYALTLAALLSSAAFATDTSTTVIYGGVTNTNSENRGVSVGLTVSTTNHWSESHDTVSGEHMTSRLYLVTTEDYRITTRGESNTNGTFGSTAINLNGLMMTSGYQNTSTSGWSGTSYNATVDVEGWSLDRGWTVPNHPGHVGHGDWAHANDREQTYTTYDETTTYLPSENNARTTFSYNTNTTYSSVN